MPTNKESELAHDDVMSILSQSMTATDDDAGAETPDTDQTDEAATDDTELDPYDSGHPLYREPEDEGDDGQDEEVDDTGDDTKDTESEDKAPGADANDKERYRYWQSQHDKLKAEKDQELNSYKQRLEAMEARLQQIGAPDQGQEKPPPTIDDQINEKSQELQSLSTATPQAPAKPSDYSETDAYTDPDSASFRYQRQVDAYNQQRLENLQKQQEIKDQLYDLKMRRIQEPAEKALAQQQMTSQQQAMVDTLQKNYKLSTEDARDFIKTMSSPDSLSLDNLVGFYKFQKGVATPSSSKPPNASGKPIRKPKANAAPPPAKGGSGGTGTDSPDEHDSFSKSLLAGSDMF